MLTAVVVLAAATFAFKGAAALVPHLPDELVARTANLAPALLAALVVVEITGDGGTVVLDAKAAAVATAILLAWRKAPLAVCIVAGAAVAALLRAI